MSKQLDWLSQLLEMITVTGRLEIRCAYGAPWRNVYGHSAAREIPYHVVLRGVAVLEDPEDDTVRHLGAGDIIMLPHGSAHIMHDGSGRAPAAAYARQAANLMISENDGDGDRLDMLCGRFFIGPPHDRLIRDYLPTKVVVRATNPDEATGADRPSDQLAALVRLMRTETETDTLGGYAMLNALSSALFTLALRAASSSAEAPTGLLALAGHPRLAPALKAMFDDPARPWTVPELAQLCSMSRATFMRHFQEKLGRSAYDLLTDIRMSMASNELKRPSATTEAVAETVGYQSVAAFRRSFSQWMGMTPGEWRRLARSPSAQSEAQEEVAAG